MIPQHLAEKYCLADIKPIGDRDGKEQPESGMSRCWTRVSRAGQT
ncbi:MAG: hypothetical protein AAGA60_15890 [Cyanobacteria bacterium P01_E01_bin.42]